MAVIRYILERGLNSGPTSSAIYSSHSAHIIRILCCVIACVGVTVEMMTLYWFARMKRKFRHTLIIGLISAALLKDINAIIFVAIAFSQPAATLSGSHYCQATGFFNQFFTECTDLIILTIVVHMFIQILDPLATSSGEGGLQKWKGWIYTAVVTIPFIDACIAFSNHYGGYQLVGAFCALPIRPFWYRLTLSWIPRYIIAVAIVTLTIIIRMRVKHFQKKLAELQASMPPPIVEKTIQELDESDSETPSSPYKSDEAINTDIKKNAAMITEEEVPPLPTDQEPFSATDLRKFKRMSYSQKRRSVMAINTSGMDNVDPRKGSLGAPSIAASSAIFASPTRDYFGDSRLSVAETRPRSPERAVLSPERGPTRRQSVADFAIKRSLSTNDPPAPQRRRSLAEISSRPQSLSRQPSLSGMGADRMSSINSTGRRSSIWDEIDASLERKTTTNRMSIFTITSDVGGGAEIDNVTYETDNYALPSPTHVPNRDSTQLSTIAASRMSARNSNRGSKIYDTVRRAMSVISLRNNEVEEVDNSPAAILRRRHKYIQRQLRYLMFYPFLYICLWLCPFVLHVLQYTDKFAAKPPLALVVLNMISVTSFGLVNCIVFCKREKPWAAIEDTDGTMLGSFRENPVRNWVLRRWNDVLGRDEGMDFEG